MSYPALLLNLSNPDLPQCYRVVRSEFRAISAKAGELRLSAPIRSFAGFELGNACPLRPADSAASDGSSNPCKKPNHFMLL
jgi:hypothetical protein